MQKKGVKYILHKEANVFKLQIYKCIYLGNATISKHSFTESQKEGKMRNKKWQNKRHIWNHRRLNSEELQQSNCLRTASRKTTWGGLNLFYSRETSPSILMQLQITNIYSVRIGVLYLISETSQWNMYNNKDCNETKSMVQYHSKARSTMGPTTDNDSQAPTIWNKYKRESAFILSGCAGWLEFDWSLRWEHMPEVTFSHVEAQYTSQYFLVT